jgi:hypothetical protein
MASGLVEQFRKGGVTRDVRLTAASGLLPLKPMDQADLLYLLSRDRDDEVREKAAASLLSMKPDSLRGILKDTSINSKILDFFGTQLESAELFELVLQNSATEDTTIHAMVPGLSSELLELVVINQTRLLRNLPILEGLEANSNLTGDQRRRLNEFRHDFKIGEKPEPVPAPQPVEREALIDLEAGPPEEEAPAPTTLEDAIATYGDGKIDEELSEEEQQQQLTVFQRVVRMTAAEKMMEGLKGNRQARMMLIRDRNRIVYQSVLASPKLTESEIEAFASMRNVSPEVLREIGKARKWTKRHSVAHELVRNPLTPIEVSMQLLPRLPSRDLKRLVSDRNVPEAVRRQAMKLKRSQQ